MTDRKKEIESLRARISKLEQIQKREEEEKIALENTRDTILKILEDANLSFEAFIRFNYKVVRRIVTKIEKEENKAVATPKVPVKRKAAAKKRKRASKAKTTVKIPAGTYKNIPTEPDTVFEVKEKGPRPKALKKYAEEIGLERFLEECRAE